ncbi:MAG TPA: FkbM family methyltransferase [Verrucomicrobiae bacterium]|nr:FkbM family methyltransferase [Verrucomicrobiae bacterium]
MGVLQVTRREPFRVLSMPWAARLYRYGYGGPPMGLWHRLKQGAARRTFFALKRHGVRQHGRALYQREGGETVWSFDANNTQFHSLFLPEFSAGYEPEVRGLIDSFLGPEDAFFDVGSNWGYFSLYAASRAGFRGKVVAYEPMPGSFSDLRDLVRATGLEGMISCVNAAVSERAGVCRMAIPDGIHSGQARVSEEESGIRVETRPLWDSTLPAPSFVKIDAEGHEWQVLAGARDVIAEQRPFLVFESWLREIEGKGFGKIFELLRELDYGVGFAAFEGGSPGSGGYRYEVSWDEKEHARMAVIEIEDWERYFLRDQLNIFAWPRERQAQVQAGGCGAGPKRDGISAG